MADYFLLQDHDGNVRAFKVRADSWSPRSERVQREQVTESGRLDVQVSGVRKQMSYTVKAYGTSSGSFAITPGTYITGTTAQWGTASDLVNMFNKVVPPENIFGFRDFDGAEYQVVFVGSLKAKPLTTAVSGDGAYIDYGIILERI